MSKRKRKNMSEADADVYHQWGMIILTIYPFPELHRLLACSGGDVNTVRESMGSKKAEDVGGERERRKKIMNET
jgi:hypothetical protein